MWSPLQRWTRRHLATVIFVGAGFHTLSGLLSPDRSFVALVRAGWFGAMGPGYAPAAGDTFWFTVSGLALFSTGFLVRSQLRATGTLPAAFGWSFVLLGGLIGTAMPVSGAWLILAIGVLALLVRQRGMAGIASPVGSPSSAGR